MTTPFIDIWINCPDRPVADGIARAAVDARLAACANVFPGVSSVYRWQGEVEQAEEVPLLLKCRAADFERVSALVRSLHPYQVPSIVAAPLAAVDATYGEWLRTQTSETVSCAYQPRRAWFREMVAIGPVSVKLNAICADGATIGDEVFEAAIAKMRSAENEIAHTPHQGAGFAILHEGEEARWLLLHWWVKGGIAARKLWRADRSPDGRFVEADPLLMACVWELGLIDFERRAWMNTAMSGKTVSDYTEERFSGEYV